MTGIVVALLVVALLAIVASQHRRVARLEREVKAMRFVDGRGVSLKYPDTAQGYLQYLIEQQQRVGVWEYPDDQTLSRFVRELHWRVYRLERFCWRDALERHRGDLWKTVWETTQRRRYGDEEWDAMVAESRRLEESFE